MSDATASASTTDSAHLPQEVKSPWNSLEIAKLVVSTSTTLAIFIVGYFLQAQQTNLSRQRSIEDRDKATEIVRYTKFIDKRIELWDKIGPIYAKLNLKVTQTEDFTASSKEIRILMAQTDELVVTYQLFFSEGFVVAVDAYDDVLQRRLSGDASVSASTVWSTYKSLRRAVARDMLLAVDKNVLAWEG
ncbi:hypothetical protein ACC716_25070 [Rhizobium johnstonii]|uniref:hypothetical protein n=1 Tax=Rhizobium johnstonii TaxID=3019933 RepID=UPI003F9DB49A